MADMEAAMAATNGSGDFATRDEAAKGSSHAVGNEDVDPAVVERIAKMAEWSPFKQWDYSTTKAGTTEEDALMRAQRFLAAQAFLLSWQRGKVPTGWVRPRRLTDLEGQYSPAVIDAAVNLVQRGVQERNKNTTERIKESQALPQVQPELPPPKPISKAEIDDLKEAYHKFSSDLFDIKTALSNASSAIAELSLRTQALADNTGSS